MPPVPPESSRREIADVITADKVVVPGVSPRLVTVARWTQYVAAVVMFTLAAWYLWGGSFIGTSKELVALVATGFFTDVKHASASAMFSELKKKRRERSRSSAATSR
jgi:hypothetical protein